MTLHVYKTATDMLKWVIRDGLGGLQCYINSVTDAEKGFMIFNEWLYSMCL